MHAAWGDRGYPGRVHPVGLGRASGAARRRAGSPARKIAFRRATLAAILTSRPDARRARPAGRLQLAREAHLPRAEARAWRALALVYKIGAQSDSNEIVLGVRVEQLQRAAHDRSELGVTLIRHAEIYHENGDMGAFRRWAMAAQTEGLASDNGLVIGGALGVLGTVALALNDYPSAAHFLDQALAKYRAIGDSGEACLYDPRATRAILATATGDLASGAAMIYEGEAAFNTKLGDTSQVFDFERGLASIDLRAGDRARATRDLDSAVAVARARRPPSWSGSPASTASGRSSRSLTVSRRGRRRCSIGISRRAIRPST